MLKFLSTSTSIPLWFVYRSLFVTIVTLTALNITSDYNYFIEQLKTISQFIGLNVILYFTTHCILHYTNISPIYQTLKYNERIYVVKNISKSIILAYMSLGTYNVIINAVFHNQWDSEMMTFLGSLYVSTDLTGLLVIPQLSTNTLFHHMTVTILGLFNIMADYTVPGLHRALVFLCYFSTFPYLVNTLLGFRHLKINHPITQTALPILSLVIYSISIIANFIYQITYVGFLMERSIFNLIFNTPIQTPPTSLISNYLFSITTPNALTQMSILYNLTFNLLYLACYVVILFDDIKLVNYLAYKAGFQPKSTPSPRPSPIPSPNQSETQSH